jgi:hypothetical protein
VEKFMAEGIPTGIVAEGHVTRTDDGFMTVEGTSQKLWSILMETDATRESFYSPKTLIEVRQEYNAGEGRYSRRQVGEK